MTKDSRSTARKHAGEADGSREAGHPRKGAEITHDDLLAQITFGVWTKLLPSRNLKDTNYRARRVLWTQALRHAFPHRVQDPHGVIVAARVAPLLSNSWCDEWIRSSCGPRCGPRRGRWRRPRRGTRWRCGCRRSWRCSASKGLGTPGGRRRMWWRPMPGPGCCWPRGCWNSMTLCVTVWCRRRVVGRVRSRGGCPWSLLRPGEHRSSCARSWIARSTMR